MAARTGSARLSACNEAEKKTSSLFELLGDEGVVVRIHQKEELHKKQQTPQEERSPQNPLVAPEEYDHLLKKFRSIVLFKSKSYFLQGSDRDDMIQEGMVGLYKAIRDFRPDRACSFRTFADVCITRQMITAVKGDATQRNLPVIYSHSLRASWDSGERDDPIEAAQDDSTDPEYILISRETVHRLEGLLRENLSPFEWDVFQGFSDGKSYQQIAEENECTPKSVDNALCRVRRKMARFSVDEDFLTQSSIGPRPGTIYSSDQGQVSERELISRVRAHDVDALHWLSSRYSPLLGLFTQHYGVRADPSDIEKSCEAAIESAVPEFQSNVTLPFRLHMVPYLLRNIPSANGRHPLSYAGSTLEDCISHVEGPPVTRDPLRPYLDRYEYIALMGLVQGNSTEAIGRAQRRGNIDVASDIRDACSKAIAVVDYRS